MATPLTVEPALSMQAVHPLTMEVLGFAGTVLSNVLAFSSLPEILHARRARDIGATNTLVFPFLCGNCLGVHILSDICSSACARAPNPAQATDVYPCLIVACWHIAEICKAHTVLDAPLNPTALHQHGACTAWPRRSFCL